MSNYANRFNEQYLLSLGRVMATIVAAIGEDHPEVEAAMSSALADLEDIASAFPNGNPRSEVEALRTVAGL